MTFGQNEISINVECINIKNIISLSIDKHLTNKDEKQNVFSK